ncbi:hypothetical protein NIES4073_54840 [Kalymmatonema gypsitolerans NIES-4073]|nr:hypothetical protein NIES4073_54840 [Scytonema sp. NIES-4073]
MNYSKRFNATESDSRSLRLPKPDAANITVLTPNLPNKPILPWTHFDSPWLESEENHPQEEGKEDDLESTLNTQESTNSEPETDDS